VSGHVWVNGAFDGRIDPSDRGLALGDGVFDTLVAFGRIPFAGDRHLARLTGQAETIGIPCDPAMVRRGWEAVLARSEAEHVILRTTVTRGVAGRGLWPAASSDPTVIVSATPWARNLLSQPARLVTSSIRRNAASPTSHLKALGYLDNVLAAREAAAAGATDALLLNTDGNVACTAIANVFAVAGDMLLTPPVEDGVLAGIMRGLVLETAAQAGLAATERSLLYDEIRDAEAVFLANSVRFLCPAETLDGHRLGAGRAEVVQALAAAIYVQVREECGVDPRDVA
jgi:branched-chain amino acid aminotransferase